jgi:hypothetical protein
MAEIQPFRAYRYDTNRVALKDVLTQPYDKISPETQKKYYAASPYNLIPVEKGLTFPDDTPQNNVYTRAAAKIEEWIVEKILLKDAAPSIYIYSQEFMVPGTQTRRVRRAAWKITMQELSSGTSARYQPRKRIALSCCETHARKPASFSCSTTIPAA